MLGVSQGYRSGQRHKTFLLIFLSVKDYEKTLPSLREAAKKSSFLIGPATPPPPLSGPRNFFPYIKEKVIFSLVAHPFSPPPS